MDRLLRVDMTEGKVLFEEVPPKYGELGGRALTSTLVALEVPSASHPLGPGNRLALAPGLLTGTSAGCSGRLSAGAKSPLTGGIKESNAGGTLSQKLARLNVAALVVQGKAPGGTWLLHLDAQGARLQRRDDLKGLKSYALYEKIHGDFGEEVAIASCGPAGEMGMCAASLVISDPEGRPTRHCGRGGLGAVMGVKGLKAVVVDDAGAPPVPIYDPAAFKEARRKYTQAVVKHPVTGEGLTAYGTNILANIINEAGGYPTRNFTGGRFEGAEKVSGETMREIIEERKGEPAHVCHKGCIIRCSNIYVDERGDHISSGLEYETIWANGANCGIDDLDVIARLDRLYDEYGLDSIEMGCALAVAMYCGVKEFGDGDGAIELVHEVGRGTPLGRILGQGAETTGRAFGCDHVPVVKGQAMPAYEPRAIKGIGVTYATSTMGADHTAGYAIASNILGCGETVHPLSREGQVELSRDLQVATAAIDSLGLCIFIAFPALDEPSTLEGVVGMLNARYGWSRTLENLMELGREVLKIERAYNLACGIGPERDALPAFFSTEKLPPHDSVFDISKEEMRRVFDPAP